MGKPYSVDVRTRVLNYIAETKDKVQASQVFHVGLATIYRWIARQEATGNVNPSPKKAYKKKIEDEKLKAYIAEHPVCVMISYVKLPLFYSRYIATSRPYYPSHYSYFLVQWTHNLRVLDASPGSSTNEGHLT